MVLTPVRCPSTICSYRQPIFGCCGVNSTTPLESRLSFLMQKIKHKAWPTNKDAAAHMKMRQNQNLVSCKKSKAESWMADKLESTKPFKWTRQAQWGIRLFDFWNYKLGIAVEVDGSEHVHNIDITKDRVDYVVSGIVVLRVRNFNEDDAGKALLYISRSGSWNDRRKLLNLKPVKT